MSVKYKASINYISEPHLDTWENRVNCTIHKFDDFLSGLEAVSFNVSIIPSFKIQPAEKDKIESESDSEIESEVENKD